MKLGTKHDVMRGGEGYPQYRIPGIVVTARGTIICYFECRESCESDWSVSDIGMKRSLDGGASWEEMRVIASGQNKNTTNNPVMLVDGETIHFLWEENYKRVFHARSTDDGATWSASREITDAFEAARPRYNWTVVATGPGHGIKLSSGRLLVPIWMASNRASITAHTPSVASTLYSDDGGTTWQVGQILRSPIVLDPNESDVAELSDGRVMINVRNNTNIWRRAYAVSDDGGASFDELRYDEALIDRRCDAGMLACRGALYFSNCVCTTARNHLTLRCSGDDGASWGESLYIEELAGYSDLAYDAVRDRIYIFYEHDHETVLRLADMIP